MRPWVPRLLTLVLAASALPAGAGCGGDFDPYNRLNSLRLLAIRSTPVAPATGETTTLDALVYTTPKMTDPVLYHWTWCPLPGPANGGYQCLVTEDQLTALAGQPVSFDLGGGDTAMLTNNLDPMLLQKICDGMPGISPPIDCTGGFPVQLRVDIWTKSDQSDMVSGVRPLRLRFSPDQEPNTNPTVGPLAANTNMGADPGDPITADGMGSPTLPRAKETDLFATVDIAASEAYTGKDDQGQPVQVYEHLTLSWFVETGTTTRERTAYLKDLADLTVAGSNKWKPAVKKDYAPDTAKLIVVIRDDRNGMGWTSGVVNLEPTP
jgi:hypothetical protein